MPQIPRGKMILGGEVGIHRWYGMDASWKLLETGHLEVPKMMVALEKVDSGWTYGHFWYLC